MSFLRDQPAFGLFRDFYPKFRTRRPSGFLILRVNVFHLIALTVYLFFFLYMLIYPFFLVQVIYLVTFSLVGPSLSQFIFFFVKPSPSLLIHPYHCAASVSSSLDLSRVFTIISPLGLVSLSVSDCLTSHMLMCLWTVRSDRERPLVRDCQY